MLVDMKICDIQSGATFEELVSELYRYLGYHINLTGNTGDQGVDIILENPTGEKTAVQCKKYSGKVSNGAVQEVFAGKHYYQCDYAMVVTNSYFTAGAKKLAKQLSVELIDRDVLNKMLMQLSKKLDKDFHENNKLTEILVNSGAGFYSVGLYIDGINLLQQIIRQIDNLKPSHAFMTYNNLGLCFKNYGDFISAVSNYKSGIQLEGIQTHDKNILLNNLSIAYRDMGDYEGALNTLDRIDFSCESDFFFNMIQERISEIKILT